MFDTPPLLSPLSILCYLNPYDLTNLVAISHADGYLQLLLDRGDEFEFLEIPAPIQAYEGLQELNEIVAEANALPFAEEAIPMLPVSSSMATSVGYDNEEQVLQIEFYNGAVYQYSGIEPETWRDLQSADSIGEFFNQEIKGRYECEPL
ncbi:KTSC domain-containing protein [Trichormus variabilis]|nr:KTSC domain-containing protein [Trichormus variabilis]